MVDDQAVIAVTGATGQQGGATARALLARGAPVVALVRDPEDDRARELASSGAELRAVSDLSDTRAVAAALAGVGAVFVMATMTGPDGIEGEIAMGTAVADAVEGSEATYLLYSSVGGAERHTGIPHFESKRRIEEHIETLETPHGFVRPVFFMDNFATVAKPAVEDGTIVVRQPLPGDVPLQLVAVDDVGATSAALLIDPDQAPDAIEIGTDELTGEQIAAAFGRRFDRPARYEQLPAETLDDDDARAMFEWFARPPAYRADFDATRRLAPHAVDFAGWLDRQPDDLL